MRASYCSLGQHGIVRDRLISSPSPSLPGDKAFPPGADISARADMPTSALRRSTERNGQRSTLDVPAAVARDLPCSMDETAVHD
jgi:hypothetical protein